MPYMVLASRQSKLTREGSGLIISFKSSLPDDKSEVINLKFVFLFLRLMMSYN